MTFRIALAAACLFAGAAHAQEVAAPAADPKVEAAYAEGEKLLVEAGAQDLFVNETRSGEGAIELRHKASGFRCVMNPGKANNKVTVFDGGLPRGDDVGCTSDTVTDSRTLYFTRTTLDVEAEAQMAAAALKMRWPKAKQLSLGRDRSIFEEMGASPEKLATLPQSWSAKFLTDDGFQRVTVGVVDGWAVKYRFSADKSMARNDRILDIFWIGVAMEPGLKAKKAEQQPEQKN